MQKKLHEACRTLLKLQGLMPLFTSCAFSAPVMHVLKYCEQPESVTHGKQGFVVVGRQ